MLITDKPNFSTDGCAIALGTFDGVHIGHRAVIGKSLDFGLPTIIVTSNQNPQSVLHGISGNRLASKQLNIAEFEKLGAYAAIFFDFDSIKDMTPIDYLNMLCDQLNVKFISCGYNYRFGKGAMGTPEFILEYANNRGISAAVCDEIDIDGQPVSSTRIRTLIATGQVDYAAKLLGRPYAIDFPVIHGEKRGRKMNFPTINQQYDGNYVLPKFGVYASKTYVDDNEYISITNVGVRPTFLSDVVLAETHIIGFSGNLYSKQIKVELIKFMRDEHKFNSFDKLKEAIANDINTRLNI